jgi:DNA polymerase III delta subunit
MYFLYYGDDVTKVRTTALTHASSLVCNGGEVEAVTDETAQEGMLTDMLGSISLFRPHEVYVVDTLSKNEERYEELKNLLPELKSSPNIFVIIEEKLGVKDERIFKEYAEKAFSYARGPGKEFNIFALTDALSARDKKSLWILLTEAWTTGKSSEEIIGTLGWQLKTIRLAAQTKSAEEAGLKPFVYDKAKRALKKFTEEEIAERAHELVMLYHDGHSGRRDIDRALEKWVLTV